MGIHTSDARKCEAPRFFALNPLQVSARESWHRRALQIYPKSQKSAGLLRVRGAIFSYKGEHVVAVIVIIINNHTNELNSSPFCRVCVFNNESQPRGKKLPEGANLH